MAALEWSKTQGEKGPEPVRMTAGEAFVQALKDEGVEVIFGYPGGAVLPIYDVLYSANIKHILVRHEQGAAFMAEGYARATGKPGVCLATSGPGATNLVTAITDAYMDSIPTVFFTGNVATSAIGTDAFQEADITGITMPITKHNYLVKRAEDLPKVIREAFHIATTGRPGPVLVDLPKDITLAEIDYVYPEQVDIPGFKPTYKGHLRQVLEAAQAINAAEKPVFYVGGGAIHSEAHEEVRRLAEKANLPTTMTLMGLGAFPADHELSLGMLGMHGSVAANWAVDQCDLLIACGARFDDRVTGDLTRFAPNAKVIHIDIDPAEISKNVVADIPIVGDIKAVLEVLIDKVQEQRKDAWLEKIHEWKKEYPFMYDKQDGVIMPQRVIEALYEVTKGEAICTADVGQHQMWLAQYYGFNHPRSHLSSGGLGAMGFGFPAAVGAAVAQPDRQVWAVTGDGSYQMNIQELATVAQYNIPVKVAIVNNSYLGMVRQWQEIFFDRHYSHSDLDTNPDFIGIAEAYGVRALRVEKEADLIPALEKAAEHDGPFVLDIRVAREANVFPMIPAGESVENMVGLKGRLES